MSQGNAVPDPTLVLDTDIRLGAKANAEFAPPKCIQNLVFRRSLSGTRLVPGIPERFQKLVFRRPPPEQNAFGRGAPEHDRGAPEQDLFRRSQNASKT